MSEIEVPLEGAQEHIEHAAHHAPKRWVTWAALTSAILAVLAAVAALRAGHLADEGMIDQIKASDTWAFYQAKGIKSAIIESRSQTLLALGKEPDAALKEKLEKYADEQKELQAQAKEHEEASANDFKKHGVFSTAVTFFQIAIAITAIAVLAKKRRFFAIACGFGVCGAFFVLRGFLGF